MAIRNKLDYYHALRQMDPYAAEHMQMKEAEYRLRKLEGRAQVEWQAQVTVTATKYETAPNLLLLIEEDPQ